MPNVKFSKTLKLYAILSAIVLLAANPDVVLPVAKSSMIVCFSTVIPSLFPFMVLSGAFVSSVTSDSFKKIGLMTETLFGIRAPANAAFIPGLVCGYPIGAKCTAELYMAGKISKSEAESIIAYSNNSGPLFVIGAVGAGMLGSAKIGIMLYATQILSALLAATILRHFTLYPVCRASVVKTQPKDLADCVCDGVRSVLNVCGFVVFFAVVNALMSPILNYLPTTVRGIVTSIMEITNGISEISQQVHTTALRLSMISFALGWSGLSVHMQVKSILSPTDISMKKYYITRFAIGVFSSVVTYLLADNSDTIALLIYKNKWIVFAVLFVPMFFAYKKRGKAPSFKC